MFSPPAIKDSRNITVDHYLFLDHQITLGELF